MKGAMSRFDKTEIKNLQLHIGDNQLTGKVNKHITCTHCSRNDTFSYSHSQTTRVTSQKKQAELILAGVILKCSVQPGKWAVVQLYIHVYMVV